MEGLALEEGGVNELGPRTILSPLAASGGGAHDFVSDETRVLRRIEVRRGGERNEDSFEKAGPRRHIYFSPGTTKVGIVTSGGLCPGINNVVRSLVLELTHRYGVSQVVGFRYGFAGLDEDERFPPIALTPEVVRHIHSRGGTVLGTSRGARDPSRMVDALRSHGVDVLIAIGGDGTMRALGAIAEALGDSKIGLIGVPKTIDNDIGLVDKTFGFETAVAVAKDAIDAAHTEASSVSNGIGLVKLMGRDAGFIAAQATLASRDVNVCLIPEAPHRLEGPGGLLDHLEQRLSRRGHAVVVVAEGCGKALATKSKAPRDPSGNVRFASEELDIGTHLKRRIEAHFKSKGAPCTLKYIDPSYMIRGVPANATDAVFCDDLARAAAHAAMAGKTRVMIGRCHRVFTHVPLALVLLEKKRIDPRGDLWLAVIEATGQPEYV